MDHEKRLLGATGGGRIATADWGDVRPYVMFITGRCGSTWLTELLKTTGLAGDPREWLNSDVATYSEALSHSLPGYFSNIVQKYSAGNRFGLQVDPVRIADTLTIIDWDQVFPAEGTRTFFLYRRDLVAQAWSWVHARKSGVWHSSDRARHGTGDPTLSRPDHSPSMRDLVSEMVALRRHEEYLFSFWSAHGYQPRFIEYETLAADPSATVATILRDLGVSPDHIENCVGEGAGVGTTRIERLNYNSKTMRMAEFAHLNRDPLTALARDRFGVSADFLAERLLGAEPFSEFLIGADTLAEAPNRSKC